MKGDYSRLSFKKLKHFAAVLSQQGRVLLDSEQNEAQAIETYLRETSLTDIIGQSGVPLNDPNAFSITTVAANDFTILPGHLYVDGIRVENDAQVTFTGQPYIPADSEAVSAPATNRTDLVYLEVWEQHVTALEDPDIREPALNIPDTTTRLRTLWRVHIQQDVGSVDCDDPVTNYPPPATAIRLTNSVSVPSTSADPCVIAPDGGYRLPENDLLRVEIHKGSDGTVGSSPTVKWSHENAAVIYSIASINPKTITVGGVAQPGFTLTLKQQARDQVLSLAANDLIEIVSGEDEIRGRPGVLATVNQRISATVYDVVPNATLPPEYQNSPLPASLYDSSRTDFKVRRWDGVITDLTAPSDLGSTGVSVKFSSPTGVANSGDYWVFAGRTANVATAAESLEKLTNELPRGVRRHYARLALIQWNSGTATIVDCRSKFPPLTDMIQMHYVSGDGQEGTPGETVKPLIVRASLGGTPLPNILVNFALGTSSGSITSNAVTTDLHGLASVTWTLDTNTNSYRQQVTASLASNADIEVIFIANLSTASEVYYNPSNCTNLDPSINTVQAAIDALCQIKPTSQCCCVTVGKGGDYESFNEAIKTLLAAGSTDICLTVLPGDQPDAGGITIDATGDASFHLKIEGCPKAKLSLTEAWKFIGLTSFVIKDVELDCRALLQDQSRAFWSGCEEVTIESCRFIGLDNNNTGIFVEIEQASQIILRDNLFRFATTNTPNIMNQVFTETHLESLFLNQNEDDFNQAAAQAADAAAKSSLQDRKAMAKTIEDALDETGDQLDPKQKANIKRLTTYLNRSTIKATTLLTNLNQVQQTAAVAPLDTAIIIDDANADTLFDNNRIEGAVSFYGAPSPDNNQLFVLEPIGQGLAPRLKDGKVTLSGDATSLRMSRNTVGRLLISDTVFDQLSKASKISDKNSDDNMDIDGLFESSFFTDNLFTSRENFHAAENLSLTSNIFRVGKVLIKANYTPPIVALMFDMQAAITNNQGIEIDNVGIDGTLKNAGRDLAMGSNLRLDVTSP